MPMYKVIGADGKEYGPANADQIRQWIAEGRLNAQTRARPDEGSADWQPLAQFPEFGEAFTGPHALAPTATPPVIKVFAILNIVLGALGLLCSPVSFASIPMATHMLGGTTAIRAWVIFSTVTSVLGSAILLVSGIGLWRLKAWARKLAVIYAWVTIFLSAAGLVIALASVRSAQLSEPGVIGGFIGGVVASLIVMAYYVLLIVFLGRCSIKQAFGETQSVKSAEKKE